jgi:hypothetical protein
MIYDEVMIALIAISAVLGGLILLTLCAFQVQVHKLELRVQLTQEQRKKKKAMLAAQDTAPIEVS